jgi:plastocyanin
MIKVTSRSFLLKTAIALMVLALPFAASAQTAAKPSVSPAANDSNSHKTHTISISYASGTWSYSIQPAQANPKRAKVKRGDTLLWVSTDGSWTVFFKNGTTPLVNGDGDPVSTVAGPSGSAAGGKIGVKAKDNDSFTYGVKLLPNGGGPEVVDDPEIIIES